MIMKLVKKIGVWMMVFSLVLGISDHGMTARAEESEEGGEGSVTPIETIVVTPFAGQWKYYGQERELIRDVHYAVSNDEDLPEEVSLSLASEETGSQAYVLTDEREPQDKSPVYQLASQAPTYEIRAYTTNAAAEVADDLVNIKDREELTQDQTVLIAPEGYRISQTLGEDAVWEKEIPVTLQEGENVIRYYVRSYQNDETRKAVDQTVKTCTVQADWTAPVISEIIGGDNGTDASASGRITGSEPGKFYYIVLPKSVADAENAKTGEEGNQGITTDYIRTRVASHYGIVGYGRVDGGNATDFSFTGLLAETEYVIYAYMTDDAGNDSAVYSSNVFQTDKMALAGDVDITGTVAVEETLTAKANLDSVDTGKLSYQWYRIKNSEDTESIDEVLDETGGAEEDDLEAWDDEEDEEEDDEEDEEEYELERYHKQSEADSEDVTTIDGATLISGATQSTYKASREDIGYRLICCVTAENYSGYVAGESVTFVPKLVPQVTKPSIASAVYSPDRKLSSIQLPAQWRWVDDTIVPVYGNSGYRAKFEPEDTAVYKTVIVRIPVPVAKKTITRKMVSMSKKHVYTGKKIKNNFELEDEKEELEKGTDFEVSYRNNKNPGKAVVTFRGIGNYKGTVKAGYTITQCPVKRLTFRYHRTKAYNGRARTAGVVIRNDSVKLKKDRDYTIAYQNNIQLGKASIVIRGLGNYKGKKTLHFTIVPPRPKISKVTKKKKTFRLQISGNRIAKGYYVYVSTSETFAKKKTQEYVTTGDRFGMRGLARGTYYIRIKCYSTQKGKIVTSGYSNVEKIKIKK